MAGHPSACTRKQLKALDTLPIVPIKGLFIPWTMKSAQGPLKFVIGSWTCPKFTSVYSKEKYQSDHGVQGSHKAYNIH